MTLLVLLLLHVRFTLWTLAGRAARWWLVAAQAALSYLPLAVFGTAWTPVLGLLAGALLLLAARTRSLELGLSALLSGPVLLATPHGSVWAGAAPALGLVEYALVHLTVRAHAQSEAIGRIATRERRRFTRDLHDLVGHRLTALGLKIELIERMVNEGDGAKAAIEAGETLELVRRLTSDVRSVAHGDLRCALKPELVSARSLLESAGVSCIVEVTCGDLPKRSEQVLTHVLREGVTNVLRHARARECVIRLRERDGLVQLSIRNDGVRPVSTPAAAGRGLPNLTERVAELGGRLEAAEAPDGQFTFTAHIPHNT
ncbi:sensor histidine kinase [Nonomuraea longicatena]|uniref:Two-component system sensor kinase n=1 Tax=Nonomuraea longicatena TaxID=83682 RepID=A0ABN1PDF0_9ACTN